MFLPIVYIHFRNTTNEKFQFTFIKDVNQVLWDKFIESLREILELFWNTFLYTPIRNKTVVSEDTGLDILDVFFLIFIGNGDVLTIRYQVDCNNFSKPIILGWKRQI